MAGEAEISQLRREEAFKDLANCIADAATYVFLSEPQITGPVKYEAIQVATARYGDRLPPPMIRSIVEAAISAELLKRREQAQARLAEREKRSVARKSTVIRSRRILGGR